MKNRCLPDDVPDDHHGQESAAARGEYLRQFQYRTVWLRPSLELLMQRTRGGEEGLSITTPFQRSRLGQDPRQGPISFFGFVGRALIALVDRLRVV